MNIYARLKALRLENITGLCLLLYIVVAMLCPSANAAGGKRNNPYIIHFSCEGVLGPIKSAHTKETKPKLPKLNQIYIHTLLLPLERGEIARLRGLTDDGQFTEIRIYGFDSPWVFDHFFLRKPLPHGVRNPGEVKELAQHLAERFPGVSNLISKKGLYAKILTIDEAAKETIPVEDQGLNNL